MRTFQKPIQGTKKLTLYQPKKAFHEPSENVPVTNIERLASLTVVSCANTHLHFSVNVPTHVVKKAPGACDSDC